MRRLFRIFIKLTGFIPAYTLLFLKLYRQPGWKRPRKGRSAIVICNHRSVIDVMLIMALFPFRSVRFLAGELMYTKSRLFSWFLGAIGCIKVDRGLSSDASYLGEVTRAARDGELICIFPEAHFNRTDELLEFREGAAFLAQKLRLPVIPIYTDAVYRPFRRTRAVLGAPILLSGNGSVSPESLAKDTQILRAAVQKMKNYLTVRKDEEDLARRESLISRIFYRFSQAGVALYLFFAYRPKISYTDPSVQKRKLREPVIVICNHVHPFDPPMLCSVFYTSRLHMLATGELFEHDAFTSWALRRFNCVRLIRSGAVDTKAFRECITLLRSGEPIGLFPEGHISLDGNIAPFMSGFLLFALQTGAPVLPVCMSHKYKFWGKRLKIVIDTPRRITPPSGAVNPEWLSAESEKLSQRLRELHSQLTSGD